MTKQWIAFWCSEGFEYIEDISMYRTWEEEQLLTILRDQKPLPNPLNQIISTMRIRGQVNSHRLYELYAFTSNDDITKDTLMSIIEDNPQFLVDWIRKNGVKIYSGHQPERPRVIV